MVEQTKHGTDMQIVRDAELARMIGAPDDAALIIRKQPDGTIHCLGYFEWDDVYTQPIVIPPHPGAWLSHTLSKPLTMELVEEVVGECGEDGRSNAITWSRDGSLDENGEPRATRWACLEHSVTWWADGAEQPKVCPVGAIVEKVREALHG